MKKPGSRMHVRIHHDMLATSAWKSLTAVEQAIYVHVASRYNGRNNGRVAVSARQAAQAVNVSKETAARALKMLVEKGFLVVTRQGAFSVKRKIATEYRLTEYKCGDETPATFDFRNWRPSDSEKIVRLEARAARPGRSGRL